MPVDYLNILSADSNVLLCFSRIPIQYSNCVGKLEVDSGVTKFARMMMDYFIAEILENVVLLTEILIMATVLSYIMS